MRRKLPKKKSMSLFKATANKTKRINIAPRVYRGGIRL